MAAAAAGPGEALAIETCQRRLWVRSLDPLEVLEVADCDIYRGESAYLFLLQFAAGLESEVVGETDVFGQFKEAWRSFEQARAGASGGSRLAAELSPWIQRLFEDTKDVRSRHLENLGGSSYGTLARRLLAPKPADRVLVVGSGAIAQSVAPYFTQCELWLSNRTVSAAHKLAETLRAQGAERVRVLEGAAEVARGWREADHALVCTPPTDHLDAERAALWAEGGARGLVLHLGCLNALAGPGWRGLAEFRALDSLFAIRVSQADARDARVEQARRACRERARQRALGGSLSLAHGWEDLAAFA